MDFNFIFGEHFLVDAERSLPGQLVSMLVAVSMASKNKFQKAVVKSNNTTVEEEPKPESEYLDEDGDQKEDEEEEDDGELNLDDVLLLGGKKVRLRSLGPVHIDQFTQTL